MVDDKCIFLNLKNQTSSMKIFTTSQQKNKINGLPRNESPLIHFLPDTLLWYMKWYLKFFGELKRERFIILKENLIKIVNRQVLLLEDIPRKIIFGCLINIICFGRALFFLYLLQFVEELFFYRGSNYLINNS